MIEARVSGISRGTESLVFRGHVPQSQRMTMRCPFQAGEFPARVKYGYPSGGVIAYGPASRMGERVFCLHPHQDIYPLRTAAAVRVPPGVTDGRCALA